jgi:rhamnose utilization protein RhaD (predicted bifunctional aldolase and dehydrogenase)/NAD(P)-dependent dehydrogenase (short-subunit alcohol dehydrogenase family)
LIDGAQAGYARLMQNLWSDAEADACIARYAAQGVGEALALRVYTSRLLGAEPRLVQHGGGNTSVKTAATDLLGEDVPAICVKGSGWDLDTIEPPGLPALRIDPLLALRRLQRLSDEDMVAAQRGALFDPASPNPSVETLLHAWIPETFIDHTHANAVLALTDQADGEAQARALYGPRMAIVPYVMPGFALAHVAADAYAANPGAEGMVLLKHGIFTWGMTARKAYDRMIEMVTLAEERLAAATKPTRRLAATAAPGLREAAPILRGLLAQPDGKGGYRRVVLAHRAGPTVLDYLAGEELVRYARAGVATPDHVIRTKPWPLIVNAGSDAEAFRMGVQAALADYEGEYRAYFERWNASAEPKKIMLDPYPRVVLVPGLGLFGVGSSAKEARIAADIAETTVEVVAAAEALGRFESIPEADLFDMEYWSLEQAKLGKSQPKPLAGQVVAITGGAGGIGAATARAFAAQGAEVVVLDRDGAAAGAVARSVKGLGLACDVTDADAVDATFDAVVAAYGGVDMVVLNAGAAWSGRIGEVSDAVLRQSFELNFFAHQSVAKSATAILLAQGVGGALLFNVSKQALNPGPDFGPYGLPKAALLHLMKQYALDYGDRGIRANAVNADRIRSGLLTEEMVKTRSAARGLSETDYMAGNLLKREVTADDVAQAFVSLALAEKTTAAVLTVDGGNIAAAVR